MRKLLTNQLTLFGLVGPLSLLHLNHKYGTAESNRHRQLTRNSSYHNSGWQNLFLKFQDKIRKQVELPNGCRNYWHHIPGLPAIHVHENNKQVKAESKSLEHKST